MKLIYDGKSYHDLDNFENPKSTYRLVGTIQIEPEDRLDHIQIGNHSIGRNCFRGHSHASPNIDIGIDMFYQAHGTKLPIRIQTKMGCIYSGDVQMYDPPKEKVIVVEAKHSGTDEYRWYTEDGKPAKMTIK